MLTAIEEDTLHWTCMLTDRDGEVLSCGEEKAAHIAETRFLHAGESPVPGRGIVRRARRAALRLVPAWGRKQDTRQEMPTGGRGAVIALPRCTCGVQTFLKADYSLKEVWQCCVPITNEAGVTWAYGLRYGHLHNLLLHALHYERGNTPFAPVLPMPPVPRLTGVEMPDDVFAALWFGWLAYREYGQYRKGVPRLAPLAETLALSEQSAQAGNMV